MCNCLHKDSKPIPKVGVGYKLFHTYHDKSIKKGPTSIVGLVLSDVYVKEYKKQNIKWLGGNIDGGFCFFLTRNDAFKAATQWGNRRYAGKTKVVKIHYSGGMGKHVDNGFTGLPLPIALCKQFRLHSSETKSFKLKTLIRIR